MKTPEAVPFFIGSVAPNGPAFDAWPTQPLLISLEQGGIDWPSSCRNGTCRTCMAQLVHGQVRYEIDWPGLSAQEKEQGCVLPCVAFACSDIILQKVSESS
jgi:ferredoxin